MNEFRADSAPGGFPIFGNMVICSRIFAKISSKIMKFLPPEIQETKIINDI